VAAQTLHAAMNFGHQCERSMSNMLRHHNLTSNFKVSQFSYLKNMKIALKVKGHLISSSH